MEMVSAFFFSFHDRDLFSEDMKDLMNAPFPLHT